MHLSLLKTLISCVFLLLLIFVISITSVSPVNVKPAPELTIEDYEPMIPVSDGNASGFDASGHNGESQYETIAVYDTGLENAYIELIVPDVLPINETLVCEVAIIDAKPGFEGLLIWYLDGESVLEKWITSDADIPGISYVFDYSRTTPETVDIEATLMYLTKDGDIEKITTETTVILENYNKTYWMELEAERVLEEVTDRYKGDFTLQWAIDNDYTGFDKEVFVNMKGYESNTKYLLWINLSHQRVNVFEGSAGEWELIECFIVGTGAPGSGTKRGVTSIPSRTAAGWHFGSYVVKPVVRFWPGTGYAFHSRILNPGTGTIKDPSIGYPVSKGCIRMYDEDIKYIYDNVPNGTTVVIH